VGIPPSGGGGLPLGGCGIIIRKSSLPRNRTETCSRKRLFAVLPPKNVSGPSPLKNREKTPQIRFCGLSPLGKPPLFNADCNSHIFIMRSRKNKKTNYKTVHRARKSGRSGNMAGLRFSGCGDQPQFFCCLVLVTISRGLFTHIGSSTTHFTTQICYQHKHPRNPPSQAAICPPPCKIFGDPASLFRCGPGVCEKPLLALG